MGRCLRTLVAAAMLAIAAPAATTAVAEDAPSGTVTIKQVHVAFLVSGAVGGGTLRFQGRSHDFTIGGLGYGGLGASRIEAEGEVFGLTRLEDFEGPYAQARAGAVAGTEQVEGGMWLANPNGVRMRLRSRRAGYALSLGGDAVFVKFD